ncbi:hypothetical protein OF001_U170084 [Pseudomonas sp. OF001]|nr:hypothetical protein OF001_U170084 [Pseudomonas sp. OF001]
MKYYKGRISALCNFDYHETI